MELFQSMQISLKETLGNDFDNLAVERTAAAAAAKIDMLVNGGGQAAIKMRAADGDIKIVEANP
jgi:cell division protein FtsL